MPSDAFGTQPVLMGGVAPNFRRANESANDGEEPRGPHRRRRPAARPRLRWHIAALISLALAAAAGTAVATATTPPTEVRIVSGSVPNTPWHRLWHEFREQLLVTEGDSLQTVLYIQSELGNEESMLSQLRRGRVQMGGFSLQGGSAAVPELGMILSPYLFNSHAEIDYVMDEHLFELFRRLFAAKGLILLTWGEVGWTNIYGRRPILSIADARGLKLRSSNSLPSQILIAALGANRIPLPFSELIPSLQTGLLDGGISGVVIFALSGAARQAPHVTVSRMSFDAGVLLANADWLLSRSPEQQRHIRAAMKSAAALRADVRAVEADILNRPAEYGIRLHHQSAAQRAQWRQAILAEQPQRKLIRSIGGQAQQVYDTILAAKRMFAGNSAGMEETGSGR